MRADSRAQVTLDAFAHVDLWDLEGDPSLLEMGGRGGSQAPWGKVGDWDAVTLHQRHGVDHLLGIPSNVKVAAL
jgi:hypothetical protein